MRLLLIALAAAVAGCASSAPPEPARSRDADGLLARPDLQAVVDLQVRRDGGALADSLASADSVVRARAAFALASVQDPGAVPALRRLLDDAVPAVRADAAFALGQSADSTAGVALAVSLRREATPAVTAELLGALGKTGGLADLGAVLGAVLPEALEPDRALALARFGTRGVTTDAWAEWLAARFQAPDPGVRQAAAYALTRSPVAAWEPHAAAVRAAFDALPGEPARMHLARALGQLADTTDAGRLADALAADPDWRTRVEAARALRELGDVPAARGALARAVDDPSPHVAQVAAEAFAALAPAQAADLARADRPWPTTAPLLAALAATDPGAVTDWMRRHESEPFAQAAALRALGAAADSASLRLLFAAARAEDTRVAGAALDGLRQRWESADKAEPRPFFVAFAQGLRRADLATTSLAAPALADSAFWPLGAGAVLREVYVGLEAPRDVEPMSAIVRAIGEVRDGGEIDFLLRVVLQSPSEALRTTARDALNDRLTEGVDVETTGGGSRPATTAIDWDQLRAVGPRPRLVLETDRGRVVLELDTEQAPQTVQRVTSTAARGLYDGVPFHRVVANFVVQGGDYERRDGYGGPETPIRSELTRLRFGTGTVGMASSGKDTEGSQFFVTHSPQPHLDGRYTAFGRVVEGQDVVDAILQGDLVREARVEPDRAR